MFLSIASPSHGRAVKYQCLTCSKYRRIPAPPTEDAPQPDVNMDPVDQVPQAKGPSSRRKKSAKPHPLPFFAREGHAVFVGNNRIDGRPEE